MLEPNSSLKFGFKIILHPTYVPFDLNDELNTIGSKDSYS